MLVGVIEGEEEEDEEGSSADEGGGGEGVGPELPGVLKGARKVLDGVEKTGTVASTVSQDDGREGEKEEESRESVCVQCMCVHTRVCACSECVCVRV